MGRRSRRPTQISAPVEIYEGVRLVSKVFCARTSYKCCDVTRVNETSLYEDEIHKRLNQTLLDAIQHTFYFNLLLLLLLYYNSFNTETGLNCVMVGSQ